MRCTRSRVLHARARFARALNSDAPYFVDYLTQQLGTEFANRDLARQSYRVYTTIDLDLQQLAVADSAVEPGRSDQRLQAPRVLLGNDPPAFSRQVHAVAALLEVVGGHHPVVEYRQDDRIGDDRPELLVAGPRGNEHRGSEEGDQQCGEERRQ